MEPFLSLLAKGFLLFSHPIIIVPLLFIGILSERNFFRKIPSDEHTTFWGNISLLILFTMIFNVLLKSLFLIPLSPSIGKEGYAFPSGHMQVSVVFYGGMFRVYSHRLSRTALLIVLIGIGYGLIQQGYHSLIDIIGSITVGTGTLYLYEKLIFFPFFKKNPIYFGLFLIPIALIMMGIIAYRTGISSHTSGAFLGLLLMPLGRYFYSRWLSKSYPH